MNFEVDCMSILPTELSLFNYDKVNSVLQSITPLNGPSFSQGLFEILSKTVPFDNPQL